MATMASVTAFGGAPALNFAVNVSINFGNWSGGIERPITVWTWLVIPVLIFWPSFDSPVMSNKWRMAASLAGSNFSGAAAVAGCPGWVGKGFCCGALGGVCANRGLAVNSAAAIRAIPSFI